MNWNKIEDGLPKANGDYLICYKWPGHGGIKYYKVMNFLHTAYDTPYMRWYDSKIEEHITHWAEIERPNT